MKCRTCVIYDVVVPAYYNDNIIYTYIIIVEHVSAVDRVGARASAAWQVSVDRRVAGP